MIRIAIVALIAALATPALSQVTPKLRATVLVAGEIVQVGDLVENAPADKRRIALYRAPDLGGTGSVPVAGVLKALRSHGVVGVAAGGLSEISVTRASRLVGTDEIRALILSLVAERLRVADAATIALAFDQPPQTLHLYPDNTAPLAPLRTGFEPRSGRFDFTFKGDNGASLRVTGVATEVHDTVVATRAIGRGDILHASDVTVEKRPKAEIQGDAIRDMAAAVGLSAQAALRPGQVLRSGDLIRPQLVKRNEPVLLFYEVPGITLTARGKAEESGALGDTINIVNVQSKRVVQGVVTGLGQVTVTSMMPRATPPEDRRPPAQRLSALGAVKR